MSARYVDDIRRLIADGLSRTEIAERLGLTKGQVCGIVHRHRSTITGVAPQRGWTPEQKAEARDMAAKGASSATIAAKFGLDHNHTRYRLAQYKISTRRAPKPVVSRPTVTRPVVVRSAVVTGPLASRQHGGRVQASAVVATAYASQIDAQVSKRTVELVSLGDEPVSVPAIPARSTRQFFGRICECQWPLNDEKPFGFCAVPSLPGKPYCPQHHAIAFRKPMVADAA